MKSYRIAVLAGDGIGKEVMPEGIKSLDVVAKKFNFELQWQHFDFASCDYYLEHGKMMPDNWKEILGDFDAIYFGAVGWPATVPDQSLCGTHSSSSVVNSISMSAYDR
jgi:tartrate dehydrogenase/decarboxylase/D-malate dehydrogenase